MGLKYSNIAYNMMIAQMNFIFIFIVLLTITIKKVFLICGQKKYFILKLKELKIDFLVCDF
jgi:hypothetical protein